VANWSIFIILFGYQINNYKKMNKAYCPADLMAGYGKTGRLQKKKEKTFVTGNYECTFPHD
jgi:hypothetical protein